MPEAVVVGITGYAQSGKDTVAARLVEVAGFTKRAFADSLRDDIYALNPIVAIKAWGMSQDRSVDFDWVRYQEAVDGLGYEAAKGRHPEIRALLQRYGTEVWRKNDPGIWIRRHETWLAAHPEVRLVVVPDVRFPNEAEYVDWLIRVNRPGVGPVNAHESDNHVPHLSVDYEVENDGTVNELYQQLEPLLRSGALGVKPWR